MSSTEIIHKNLFISVNKTVEFEVCNILEIKRTDINMIGKLNISFSQKSDNWIRESFLLKKFAILHVEDSIRLNEYIFTITMPCAIPSIGIGVVKIVSCYPNRKPSIDNMILLFKS